MVSKPTRFLRFTTAVVAAAALSGGSMIAAGPQATAATGTAAPVRTVSVPDEAWMAAKINAARKAARRSTLVVRADLVTAARAQANRMATQNRLHHSPHLGGSVRNFRLVGENVGVGFDAGTLHNAFMASTAHRANLMNARFSEIGVGVVRSGGRLWVVEVLRQPVKSVKAAKKAKKSTAYPVLRYGSRGPAVKRLQAVLHVRRSGWFGPITKKAVIKVQECHRLRATGVVDARTWRAVRG